MNGREVVQIEISIDIPSDEYNVLSFKCVEVLNPWASFTLYFGDSDLQTDKHTVLLFQLLVFYSRFCCCFVLDLNLLGLGSAGTGSWTADVQAAPSFI